jgi:hypothetical protein
MWRDTLRHNKSKHGGLGKAVTFFVPKPANFTKQVFDVLTVRFYAHLHRPQWPRRPKTGQPMDYEE